MSTMLETRRMIAGELPPAPMGTLIGLRLVSIDPGRARFELDADQRHHNPMGTLQAASSATSPTARWAWPTRRRSKRARASRRWS